MCEMLTLVLSAVSGERWKEPGREKTQWIRDTEGNKCLKMGKSPPGSRGLGCSRWEAVIHWLTICGSHCCCRPPVITEASTWVRNVHFYGNHPGPVVDTCSKLAQYDWKFISRSQVNAFFCQKGTCQRVPANRWPIYKPLFADPYVSRLESIFCYLLPKLPDMILYVGSHSLGGGGCCLLPLESLKKPSVWRW